MPYAGDVYSLPPGTSATSNTTILSAMFNAFVADIAAAQNAARPVTAGGTGAATVIGGHDALFTKGSDIASASTINLNTATGAFVDITGTTTITAVTLSEGKNRIANAAGAFTITASASLIVNGSTSQNYTCSAGDLLIFEGYASSIVRVWVVARSLANSPTARRNRIVNGDMRLSQENGTSSGTSNGYYAVDQFATYRVTSAGTITSAQVASVTPAGSPNRYRVTITAADASLAAGEYLTITQNLEGSNVADLQYGGSSAKNIMLRFGFKGPAGTYAARLGNSAANRSYVALFTIAAPDANTDTVQTFSIAGDQTGTWLTADGVIGLTLDIVLACGSTFQGTTGWQAGLIYGTSGVTNGMATISSVFELFDVGLKLDPDATGVYGAYEVGEVDAVYRSERYYTKKLSNSLRGWAGGAGSALANMMTFPVEMCKAPAVVAISVTATGNVAVEAYEVITTTGYRFRLTSTASGDTFTLERLMQHNARLS